MLGVFICYSELNFIIEIKVDFSTTVCGSDCALRHMFCYFSEMVVYWAGLRDQSGHISC